MAHTEKLSRIEVGAVMLLLRGIVTYIVAPMARA